MNSLIAQTQLGTNTVTSVILVAIVVYLIEHVKSFLHQTKLRARDNKKKVVMIHGVKTSIATKKQLYRAQNDGQKCRIYNGETDQYFTTVIPNKERRTANNR